MVIIHGSGDVRDIMARRLSEAGYEVACVENGRAGMDLMKADSIDLAIVDVHAPDMSGPEFVAGVRADETTQDTPVIVLAHEGEAEAVDMCMRSGAEDFLYAPYSPTILKAQIRDYLHIGEARKRERQMAERESLLKIERDVLIARQIQLGFLPKELPKLGDWEIAASFHPAREVAGDFYDAFTLSHGRRLGFVIADVCDKGVGAALFMALFRSLYRAYAMQNYSMRWTDVLEDELSGGRPFSRQRAAPSTGTTALKNAMDLTNDYIAKNHGDSNMFATTFFGVLDPSNGQLVYVNGGHNPPAILSTSSGQTVIKARLKPTGPAPGMFPDVDYKIEQVLLDPGDMLFCFTDGVTDARDPRGEFFGEKRLLTLVEQPNESAAALLSRIDVALHSHIAEASQFDDITMLALHRQQPGQKDPL